jgi:hypothetical protein
MIAAADRRPDQARVRRGLGHVFLGDWHPMLRDRLDLFRLSLVAGAVAFAIAGDGGAAVRLALPGLLGLGVRTLDVPREIDWIFCLAMAFQGWGNALELFTELSWYDNTVHVTLPMSLAPIIYLALSRIDVVPDPCDRAGARAELFGMVFVTLCIGVSAASVYEIYEWVVVNWLGQAFTTSPGSLPCGSVRSPLRWRSARCCGRRPMPCSPRGSARGRSPRS